MPYEKEIRGILQGMYNRSHGRKRLHVPNNKRRTDEYLCRYVL